MWPVKYESASSLMAMDREMKGFLVITVVTLAAATAVAYGHADLSAAAVNGWWPGEPASLLLSGGALLGLGGLLRRYAF